MISLDVLMLVEEESMSVESMSGESMSVGLGSSSDSPKPELKPIGSKLYLDAATRQKWANNDMTTINAKRKQAQDDLSPIYKNIKDIGEKAWVKVVAEGQEYYTAYNEHAVVWSYVKDEQTAAQSANKVKSSRISIGSYSKGAGMMGISNYIWHNLKVCPIQYHLHNSLIDNVFP